MPTFSLVTLGDLVVLRDGQRAGEARRKPLAVLAYLAAEAPRGANRDLLAGMLWPESSPDRARRTLTQTIYALRREFHEELIVGTSQLSLGPALADADIQRFLQATASGEHERALALYAGPFLEGVSFAGTTLFEQWAEAWRARLAGLHRTALLAEAERLHADGQLRAASSVLQSGRRWYPADAEIAEHCVRVQLALGATADALDTISRLEQLWHREYELPLPRTLEMVRRRIGVSEAVSTLSELAPAAEAMKAAPLSGAPDTIGADALDTAPTLRQTRTRQWWPRGKAYLVAGVAVFAMVLTAAVSWMRASAVHRPEASATASTLGQLQQQYRARVMAERLAATDSSHLGRMLVLTPVNATRDASLDTAMDYLSYTAYALEHSLLAKPVPESIATRLITEAAATRLPTTTQQQIYAVMRATGAALAVRPVLYHAEHDSLLVAFDMYRDISHTDATNPRFTPLETISGGGIGGRDVSVVGAAAAARSALFQFLKSLERCDLAAHGSPETAPWCWTEDRVLSIVPGLERWPVRRVTQARATP